MLPIKEIINKVSYSRDYVTRLARENKIEAVHVGRQWFINLQSLEQYMELTSAENELRKQKLSAERKREKEIYDAKKKQRELSERRTKNLNAKATVAASLTLALGLLGGVTFFNHNLNNNKESNLATVSEANTKTEQQDIIKPVSEVKSLGESKLGVLLLPTEDTNSVADLFSDEVEIIKTEDGTKAIILINEEEREVPFIEIPVNQHNQ